MAPYLEGAIILTDKELWELLQAYELSKNVGTRADIKRCDCMVMATLWPRLNASADALVPA